MGKQLIVRKYLVCLAYLCYQTCQEKSIEIVENFNVLAKILRIFNGFKAFFARKSRIPKLKSRIPS